MLITANEGASYSMAQRTILKHAKQTAQRPSIVKGQIKNRAFYFTLIINGKPISNIILDTGAFELTINEPIARSLRLPNLGPIRVSGIGGSISAYRSRCNLTVGKIIYRNVPCIVVPGLISSGLFGLRFFIDNQLKLEFNPRKQMVVITHA